MASSALPFIPCMASTPMYGRPPQPPGPRETMAQAVGGGGDDGGGGDGGDGGGGEGGDGGGGGGLGGGLGGEGGGLVNAAFKKSVADAAVPKKFCIDSVAAAAAALLVVVTETSISTLGASHV